MRPTCFLPAAPRLSRVLCLALALGSAAGAGAQPAWMGGLKQHKAGLPDLCCGVRGGFAYEDNVATPDAFAPRDILQPVMPQPLLVQASVAMGAAAAVPADDAQPAAKTDAAGVYQVSFDHLSAFEFVAPPDETGAPEAEKQIPGPVRALDEKKVAVTGFMLPVKMDSGLVTEFLLVKDPMMCCYGIMPKVNEWVVVRMNGKGVPPLMDVPVTFEGTLQVGQLYEGGYLTGLYLLQGDKRVESKG